MSFDLAKIKALIRRFVSLMVLACLSSHRSTILVIGMEVDNSLVWI